MSDGSFDTDITPHDSSDWLCPFCMKPATVAMPSGLCCRTRTCSCGAVGLGAPAADLARIVLDTRGIFQGTTDNSPGELYTWLVEDLRRSGVEVRPGVCVQTPAGIPEAFAPLWFRRIVRKGVNASLGLAFPEIADSPEPTASCKSQPVEMLPAPPGDWLILSYILLSDEMNKRLVVVAGETRCTLRTFDFATMTWQTVDGGGQPLACPPFDTAVMDQRRGHVVMRHCCHRNGEFSIFDPTQADPWIHRIALRPPQELYPQLGPRLLVDENRDRCLLLSSRYLTRIGAELTGYLGALDLKNHTWQTVATRPIRRHGSEPCMEWAQIDPIEDRVVFLGKRPRQSTWNGNLWLLNLENGDWEHIDLSGDTPPRKEGNALTLIPQERVLLVCLEGDRRHLWRCDLRNWHLSRVALPSGLDNIPFRHAACYCQHRQAICLLTGGLRIRLLPLASLH